MYKSNLLSIHCVRAMVTVCALLSLFFSAHTAQAQGQPPQTPLSYIENGFTFSLPTGVPFFAKGAGSFPNGNGSVSNNATDSVIAYCPSCGTTGVLTITNNSNATFKLTSFNLGGFQPPNNFTVNVVGYDLNSNVVYQSGAISVTGIYSIRTPTSSTLQGVQLGMTTAVSSITITPSNGGSDCVCLEKFVLETGGNTVVALDGVGATTTVTAPAAANNNNNNSINTRKPKAGLFIELKRTFHQLGWLAKNNNQINEHKIVATYNLAQDTHLQSEFAMKNGMLNLVETIDFRTGSIGEKRLETQSKALVMDYAKDLFKKDAICTAIIAASDYSNAKSSLKILDKYADRVIDSNSNSDMNEFFTDWANKIGSPLPNLPLLNF